jgi:hypothetical protein
VSELARPQPSAPQGTVQPGSTAKPRELAPTSRRYRLAEPPAAALARLAEASGVEVVSPTDARSRRSSNPFVVIGEAGFVLYQPWQARLVTPEGALIEDLRVGPAVVGRVEADPDGNPGGCLVSVRVRPYAPTPRQWLRMAVSLTGTGLLFAAMLLAAGPHPLLLLVAVAITVASGIGLRNYQRDQRRQDIRELLAVVERTFAPRELPAGDRGPHRRPREP